MNTPLYTAKPNLTLTVMEDHAAIAKAAANQIATALRKKPGLVIGLATGATMEPVYAELVRMHTQEGLNFSKAHFFNLDAYKGLPSTDRNSYANQLKKLLLDPVGANPDNVSLVQGIGFDPDEYERKIKDAGGIDIQLLGLGGEGHIGFNELGSAFDSRTRLINLLPRTLEDNAMYFSKQGEKVPPQAYTMGIGTILEAKEIIVLANNPNKAFAVRNMMDASGQKPQELSTLELAHMNRLAGGKVNMDHLLSFAESWEEGFREKAKPVEELPARALHAHSKVTMLVDKEAASMVRVSDLINHSNLKGKEIDALVERFAPRELDVTINDTKKKLLLTPGFDFFDPKVMALNEKFDPQKREHVEALERVLTNTTDVGVGAHQDDIEIMAAPALLSAARTASKQWLTVIVTDGAASKSVLNGKPTDLTPRQLTDMRQREQRQAAKDAGTPVIQLKYPSAAVNAHMGTLKKQEAALSLGTLFAAMPNLEQVFGHNPIDKHATHLATFAVQTAALRAAKPPMLNKVYAMEVWGGLTGIPEVQLSMFPVEDGKDLVVIRRLIDHFQSQIIGQDRAYSNASLGRAEGHGGFVTSPHLSSPPPAMFIGLDVTDFTKGAERDQGELGRDILERAAAIKIRFARAHQIPEPPSLEGGFTGNLLRKPDPNETQRH